jgi:hypothetical protein
VLTYTKAQEGEEYSVSIDGEEMKAYAFSSREVMQPFTVV